MSNHCSPEEKQHMLDLVDEVKRIQGETIPKINQIPVPERVRTYKRLREIQKEMVEFRRMYPDD